MKLLIGYDHSPEATTAVHDLRNAGLPATGEGILLGIADYFIPPAIPESPFSATEQAALIARAHAEERRDTLLHDAQSAALLLKEDLPGWSLHGEAAIDAPAWGLLKRADEWKADLICVGSPGSSRLERLFFGSICQKVVSHAHCSVRIGRKGPDGGPLRLLLAMDGSPDARAAAAVICSRRWPAGSEVCIVSVRDSRFAAFSGAIFGDSGEAATKEAEEKFAAAGLKASHEMLDGKPASVLVEKAADWGAHCIFAGAGGHNALERLVLGSVSSALTSRAACSVEIVRR
jgi:nucleotide-binding universal stress UspA family protein